MWVVSVPVVRSRLGDNVQLKSPAIINFPDKEDNKRNNFSKKLGQSVLGPTHLPK